MVSTAPARGLSRAGPNAVAEPRPRPGRVVDAVVVTAGLLCAAVGVIEMVAWWARVSAILRWPGDSPAMVFNTALAFTVTGVAFCALWRGRSIVVAVAAGFDLVLGALVLVEHLLNRNLGIDQLLAAAYISQAGGAPGRLAVNTAVCFVVTGAGLLAAVAASTVPTVRSGLALSASGSLVAAVTALALIGQATGTVWAYTWTPNRSMALETAVTMAFVATGLLALAVQRSSKAREWLALPAGAAAFVVAAAVWIVFDRHPGQSKAFAGASETRAGVAMAVLTAFLVGLISWLAIRAEHGRRRAEREAERRAAAEHEARVSEARLAEASAYTRSLIEASPDPLVTISAEGKITDVNQSAVRATGLSREAMVGTDFSDYFTEPDAARSAYRRAFAEGQITDCPLTMRHASGELTEVLYSASVYRDTAGDTAGVVAAARDVSALRHAEGELARRAAALDAANRELARSNTDLEQFAFIASHDLREPLFAISMPLQIIAKRLGGRLDAQEEEFLGYALDGCQRMDDMIRGLLAFSRVGRIEGSLEPTDADQAVKQALAALGGIIECAHAGVTVDRLPTVTAEPDQLAQVFQNLISNAVKFVEPGVTPRVTVSAERECAGWRFDVTDNGIGVPPQERDGLFAMFKRLHSFENYPGTGIGLALVKRIVERHGGTVGIDDAPDGNGSRFWFTLPGDGPPGPTPVRCDDAF